MFSIATESLDVNLLRLSLDDSRAGAYVSFEGWVRDHNEGRAVTRLEYEAHQSLAVSEAERILLEAKDRFGLIAFRCIHRVGTLAIGELAVWVGVTAAHRAEAFEGCRYIIDEIKARLPIWKKEHYADGSSQWVNCQSCSSPQHQLAAASGSGTP